jgi:hypothetical protein
MSLGDGDYIVVVDLVIERTNINHSKKCIK